LKANEGRHQEALSVTRTFVPPTIFSTSREALVQEGLSHDLAKRIWQKKVGMVMAVVVVVVAVVVVIVAAVVVVMAGRL